MARATRGRALSARIAPFDAAAPGYDRDFTATRLGRLLRAATHAEFTRAFAAGSHLLELGCGTGEDALWLARRGCTVVATDLSPLMLEIAAKKVREAGLESRVTLRPLDLAAPDLDPSLGPFDGVLSNFGALNCLESRAPLARWLAGRLRPGARLVLVPMGPICLWEIGWHLLHGEARASLRRLSSPTRAHAGGGKWLDLWYPGAGTLAREFGPDYTVTRVAAIGLLLPPSYLAELVARRSALFDRLARMERRLAALRLLNQFGDHYALHLEWGRRGAVKREELGR